MATLITGRIEDGVLVPGEDLALDALEGAEATAIVDDHDNFDEHDLDDETRADLEESIAQADAGRTRPLEDFLAEQRGTNPHRRR